MTPYFSDWVVELDLIRAMVGLSGVRHPEPWGIRWYSFDEVHAACNWIPARGTRVDVRYEEARAGFRILGVSIDPD